MCCRVNNDCMFYFSRLAGAISSIVPLSSEEVVCAAEITMTVKCLLF